MAFLSCGLYSFSSKKYCIVSVGSPYSCFYLLLVLFSEEDKFCFNKQNISEAILANKITYPAIEPEHLILKKHKFL
jgi:hypothetical protein